MFLFLFFIYLFFCVFLLVIRYFVLWIYVYVNAVICMCIYVCLFVCMYVCLYTTLFIICICVRLFAWFHGCKVVLLPALPLHLVWLHSCQGFPFALCRLVLFLWCYPWQVVKCFAWRELCQPCIHAKIINHSQGFCFAVCSFVIAKHITGEGSIFAPNPCGANSPF